MGYTGKVKCIRESSPKFMKEGENQPNETDITDTAPPIQRF